MFCCEKLTERFRLTNIIRVVKRREDMSPNGSLALFQQDDGDIILVVTNNEGRSITVEFCTIFGGGGGSPNTFEALQKLFEAMELDNREHLARQG